MELGDVSDGSSLMGLLKDVVFVGAEGGSGLDDLVSGLRSVR